MIGLVLGVGLICYLLFLTIGFFGVAENKRAQELGSNSED